LRHCCGSIGIFFGSGFGSDFTFNFGSESESGSGLFVKHAIFKLNLLFLGSKNSLTIEVTHCWQNELRKN
jgi:hypothetical protein